MKKVSKVIVIVGLVVALLFSCTIVSFGEESTNLNTSYSSLYNSPSVVYDPDNPDYIYGTINMPGTGWYNGDLVDAWVDQPFVNRLDYTITIGNQEPIVGQFIEGMHAVKFPAGNGPWKWNENTYIGTYNSMGKRTTLDWPAVEDDAFTGYDVIQAHWWGKSAGDNNRGFISDIPLIYAGNESTITIDHAPDVVFTITTKGKTNQNNAKYSWSASTSRSNGTGIEWTMFPTVEILGGSNTNKIIVNTGKYGPSISIGNKSVKTIEVMGDNGLSIHKSCKSLKTIKMKKASLGIYTKSIKKIITNKPVRIVSVKKLSLKNFDMPNKYVKKFSKVSKKANDGHKTSKDTYVYNF